MDALQRVYIMYTKVCAKSPLVLAYKDETSKTLLTLKCLLFCALVVQSRILLLHIAYFAYHIILQPLNLQP